MSKKVYFPVILLVLFAMLLGACAPAAQPTEAPIVEAPVATEVPATAVPTAEPVVEAPDFQAIFADIIANNGKEKGYGTINAEALNTEMIDNADLFVIDVREPSELEETGHIPGAVNIPVKTLADNLALLPQDLDTPIVVYCKSGTRSTFGWTVLNALGFSNVRNLTGGFMAWSDAAYVADEGLAPAEEISTPIIENEALYTAIKEFANNPVENWSSNKNTDVNDMMINGEKFVLVDVRRADEYEAGHIDTSINIPLEELMSSLDQIDPSSKLVLYCKSGVRSLIGTLALQMNGYTNVLSMSGGYIGWKTAELPVVGEAPDFTQLYANLIANNGKELGYGTVAADVLNTELVENADLFVLDIREPAEFEADGYIQSTNYAAVPLRQLFDNLDKLPSVDTPMIVYCKSGHRGAFAWAALKLMGYDVRNLAGGIGAWKKAEFPVEMAAAPVAEAISTPIVANEALFTALHDYLAAIPDDFYATSAANVNEMIINAETFTLLDVRRADEFAEGYIETAINIPLEDLMTNLAQLPDKDTKIVIYCKSGHRGGVAVQALHQLGYTNVINLGGGMNAWVAAELPTVK
ncbi:MAG: hypothetical protein CVU39_22060 [Chloroflexi bacterium HGW-Chloroflexi-10]|nr:MAG: hypothetical protein CVU39_22060 [Chloroflexi bacterium HGW-Chloroflexi-10]